MLQYIVSLFPIEKPVDSHTFPTHGCPFPTGWLMNSGFRPFKPVDKVDTKDAPVLKGKGPNSIPFQ